MHLLKKGGFFLILTGLLQFGKVTVSGQNLQLFFDTGRWIYANDCPDRPYITSTVEMLHTDKYGLFFYLVDMDYTKKGIYSAYWQLIRELQFWKFPLSIQLQYDGGLTNQYSFNHAYAIGPKYNYNNDDNTRCFSGGILYKYIQGNPINPHNFQVSITWYISFAKGLLAYNGYADFWQEPQINISDYAFLTKPQLYFNFNKLKKVNDNFNLSLGTEIRISYNFFVPDKFMVIPALAIKWTFWE
jgi:hypothetical protein